MAAHAVNTALVTGGGSGVGAAIAVALAEAGFSVIITGRRQSALDSVAETHPGIQTAVTDITDEAAVKALFADLKHNGRAPDLVVANAGAAESAPIARTDMKLWNDTLAVNLTGVFLTFREALAVMDKKSPGRLIAIASTAGLKGFGYVSAYCAAKHGTVGLVRSVAQELARSQITVNAVCPGYTQTPMLDRTLENIMARTGLSEDEARASLLADNPQKRFVQPSEIADAVLWLAGEGAASVNGQAIAISGGEI
jgi:3-hydroxybutyrate dehydrogenase